MKIHSSITFDRIESALSSDECLGFCVECGEDQFGVEPDAEKYECSICGARKVFGVEQLLFLTEC